MRLSKWIKLNGPPGARRIADAAEVHVVTVYRWAKGLRTPTLKRAEIIFEATNHEVGMHEIAVHENKKESHGT